MKHTRLMKLLATGAASVLAMSAAFAQETSTSTTTTDGRGNSVTTTRTVDGTGVVSAYTPGQDYISFRGETDTAPVRYYYTKNTTVVDPDGRTVEWSALRPDMPVRYTYVNDGGRMVVSKVTLVKPLPVVEKETTSTTTTTVKH